MPAYKYSTESKKKACTTMKECSCNNDITANFFAKMIFIVEFIVAATTYHRYNHKLSVIVDLKSPYHAKLSYLR